MTKNYYKNTEDILNYLRRSIRNYISYGSGPTNIQLNWANTGCWMAIPPDTFKWLLEEKLITSISEFTDAEYCFRLTNKGLNHRQVYTAKDSKTYYM